MNAHLVSVGAVVELRVIDEVGAPVVGGNDAIMPLGTLAYRLEAPLVVSAHDFLTTLVGGVLAIVQHPAGELSRTASGVFVGTVGFV